MKCAPEITPTGFDPTEATGARGKLAPRLNSKERRIAL